MGCAELDLTLSTVLSGLVELHILCKLLPNLERGSTRLALLLCIQGLPLGKLQDSAFPDAPSLSIEKHATDLPLLVLGSCCTS